MAIPGGRGGETPTLEMVAAEAGVSRSTVSRVVNGSPKVTDDAIAAVTAAIDKLGYVPNRAARMLAQGQTFTIALVIPENTARFFSDPFLSSVVQGAAQYLASTDYTLALLMGSEASPEKTRRFLLGGNVDGVLVLSHHSDDRSYAQLGDSLPVVFGGRPMTEVGNSYVVDVDNVAAARDATSYLVRHGRTRIATIAGPADMAAGLDRVQGWRKALRDAELGEGPLEHGDFSPTGGAEAMRRLLARDSQIDAVFAASAQMAFGALGVLRESGHRVPDDVSITAIDNDHYATTAEPPLTTIEQPTVGYGETIARTLVRIIAGETVERTTIMPTTLIERESVSRRDSADRTSA